MMLLARADAGKELIEASAADFCAVVREAAEQGEKLARTHDVRFSLHLPEGSCLIRGDADALRRVILILIDNAAKYTPAGGSIELHLQARNGVAVASVTDTGIGIAQQDLIHIFDRFWRADRARSREHGGAGLGLSIAKWIVEMHRGSIEVESESGKGSTFEVHLPVDLRRRYELSEEAFSLVRNDTVSAVRWPFAQQIIRLTPYDGRMRSLAFILSLASGALITLQTGSNSQLKKSLNQPLYALIVNYFLGVTAVILYTAVRRVQIPSVEQAAQSPWWAWIGGLFGAAYGLAAIFYASQLGAATLTALVVTGQLVCAVTLDHFGWWSFDVHPAGAGRIAGCVLMVVGLVLIAKY